MSPIKVALAGVGSCASSLVQLVQSAKNGTALTGVFRQDFCGFSVSDVEFVAAFDVDQAKVGLDLSEAVSGLRTAAAEHIDIPLLGVTVVDSPLMDGINGRLQDIVMPTELSRVASASAVVDVLRKSGAEVVVCFLPTGASEAARMFAESAAEAGAAFVNGTPSSIARSPELQELYREKRLPLLGDDMRSMLGATTLHAALIQLLLSKGIQIDGTYQLNVGGNADFLNLSDPARASSKVISKANALAGAGIDAENLLAGPSGFAEYLQDTKICHINIRGTSVVGSGIEVDVRLTVEDSPNAAGTMIDGIRAAKVALERGLAGPIVDPSYMLFKSPPFGAVPHEESEIAMGNFIKNSNATPALENRGEVF